VQPGYNITPEIKPNYHWLPTLRFRLFGRKFLIGLFWMWYRSSWAITDGWFAHFIIRDQSMLEIQSPSVSYLLRKWASSKMIIPGLLNICVETKMKIELTLALQESVMRLFHDIINSRTGLGNRCDKALIALTKSRHTFALAHRVMVW